MDRDGSPQQSWSPIAPFTAAMAMTTTSASELDGVPRFSTLSLVAPGLSGAVIMLVARQAAHAGEHGE